MHAAMHVTARPSLKLAARPKASLAARRTTSAKQGELGFRCPDDRWSGRETPVRTKPASACANVVDPSIVLPLESGCLDRARRTRLSDGASSRTEWPRAAALSNPPTDARARLRSFVVSRHPGQVLPRGSPPPFGRAPTLATRRSFPRPCSRARARLSRAPSSPRPRRL